MLKGKKFDAFALNHFKDLRSVIRNRHSVTRNGHSEVRNAYSVSRNGDFSKAKIQFL